MTVADPIRVAVVGFGLGGSVFHAPIISASPRLSLDLVVTSDPVRAAAARDRYRDTTVVASVAEVLDRRNQIDLVVISVPNAAHVDVAVGALEAGLAVVIDKPVAPSAAEVRALGELARSVGRPAIPFHNRRWDGDFRTVRHLLDGGELGDVWRFESRFERWRPAPPADRTWKQDATLAGGGILYDLGTHLVDQAVVLFGRPMSLYAEMPRRRGGLDDDTFLALSYADGLIAHLWMSSKAAQKGPRFRVLASAGSYVKWGLDGQEDALRRGEVPGAAGWGEEPRSAWGRLGSDDGSRLVPTRAGAYEDFYRAVAACLLDGAPPPVTMDDAALGLDIIEAAIASAHGGGAVPLA